MRVLVILSLAVVGAVFLNTAHAQEREFGVVSLFDLLTGDDSLDSVPQGRRIARAPMWKDKQPKYTPTYSESSGSSSDPYKGVAFQKNPPKKNSGKQLQSQTAFNDKKYHSMTSGEKKETKSILRKPKEKSSKNKN